MSPQKAQLTRVRGRLAWLAPVAAMLAVVTAAGNAPSGANLPTLRSISSRLDGGMSTVLIEATEPVAYLTSQPDPLTVHVDLRNVNVEGLASRRLAEPQSPVNAVEVTPSFASDGAPVARVSVQLDRAARHRVRSSRNLIYIEVDRTGAPVPVVRPPAPAAAPPRAPMIEARAARAAATEITAVKAAPGPEGMAVTLSGNGRLVASRVEEVKDLPPRVLLDFEGVGMGRVPAATTIRQGDIERVRVAVNSRTPLITRVVIDLARKLPYTVESVGEDLRVMFARALDAAAAAVVPASADAPAPQTARDEPTAGPAVDVPPAPALAPASAMTVLLGEPQAQPGQTISVQPSTQPVFSGHAVTLDFQGADLRAVLRTFAEISGLNIVIDPSINGTVDVSLREVPWDQALDVILKANKLGYTVDGTIVRIAPLTTLAQENEEQRKLQETRANAGELRVMTRPLSYAKAQDLVPILTKSALSPRGDVQIDTRTNTLIIRDLSDRLDAATELLTSLDKPQPQVEIEARIVQTTREFARSLGVQWGFNARLDPAIGTGTGLAFPNSAAIGGRVGPVQGPGNSPTAVNLPAPAANNAIGLALGSINGAFNLDVALTALESQGKGRVLSTPRVSTQNNIEAEMTQGIQIPIQTQANNTVTVSFKDAALTLRVTPQITASNTVIMRINLENAQADFSRAVNGIPPIDTQRAVTTVLVSDGDTTVIGGIYLSIEQAVEGRTPGLHRVPLLGWLFKRDTTTDLSRELLIFITPRIMKG